MFWALSAQAVEPSNPSPELSQPKFGPTTPSTPLPTAPTPATAPAVRVPATLLVQRFDVIGNTLIPPVLVQDRLKEFLGAASLQQLRNAAAAVQELHGNAGYGGVVAFLPGHTPQGGVVRIRVVEGRLTRIEIAGNQQFSDDDVRASVPALILGRTPEVRLIDAQIQIANESPAKQVQVLLQPGTEPGSVTARVSVAEQPVQRIAARVDNTGTDSTGRWRAALGRQHGNLWDADHALSLEVQTAPEHPNLVLVTSAGYRAPLYTRAMAIDASAARSDVDSGRITSPAGDVQLSKLSPCHTGRADGVKPDRSPIGDELGSQNPRSASDMSEFARAFISERRVWTIQGAADTWPAGLWYGMRRVKLRCPGGGGPLSRWPH
jgi:hemolysin activation/secretion protein